jgi:hypothetical protein
MHLVTLETELLAREMRQDDPLTPEADDDMGWDNPLPAAKKSTCAMECPPESQQIPLISAEDCLPISIQQYKAYVEACRNVIPWRALYPQEELCVGEKGIL